MKILDFIFNLLFSKVADRFEGLISTSMISVVQEVVHKSRKALLIGISTFVFGVLFAAGVLIAIIDAAKQYDSKNAVMMTAMLGAGLTLVVISLSALALLLWPRSKSIIDLAQARKAKLNTEPPPHASAHTSPFEEIITVAAMEAMQFFKNKSDKRAESDTAEQKVKADKAEMKRYDARLKGDNAKFAPSQKRNSGSYQTFNTGTAT